MLLVVAAIWGIAGPVIKYTLQFLSPATFLTYRYLLTSAALIPILLESHPRIIQTIKRFTKTERLTIIFLGLIGSIGQIGLIFWGFSLTSSLDGTLIAATSPILVAIAGHFMLKDHVTLREKMGLVIATLGTVVVVIQPLIQSGKLFSGSFLGNLLILGGNLCWTIEVILSKKFLRRDISPLFLTTSSFAIGLIALSIFAILHPSSSSILNQVLAIPFSAHLAVWYMAFFSGALAYLLYQTAQKSIETSEADLFNYLAPVFAIPLSYLWLKEPITSTFAIGAVAIALGVASAEFKKQRV